jgi:hypothetical protein
MSCLSVIEPKNIPAKGFDLFFIEKKVHQLLVRIGFRYMLLVISLLRTGYLTAKAPCIRQQRPYGQSHRSLLRRLAGISLNAIGLVVIGEYLWRGLEAAQRFLGLLVDMEISFPKKKE